MKLTPVIGLEVHLEPATKSKMFCDCFANHFGVAPNTNVCPVCLGMPGALPVPNKEALKKLVILGKALGCQLNSPSYFERKNYFYPDLPKGYQISQYRKPLCVSGKLPLPSGKVVRVNRAHMEEDTAKMKHRGEESLIDFNRSGVPLIEVVSEADISTAQEAKEYLKQLARLARWLGVSDASMEKGTMRLEANVSLQEEGRFAVEQSRVVAKGDYQLNPRVELKNINSYRFVEKAIAYEIRRQKEELLAGKTLQRETRGWDETRQETFLQRSKESSSDYRYFPEPDIPPIEWGEADIAEWLFSDILPWEADTRLREDYRLSSQYIAVIGQTLSSYRFFEKCLSLAGEDISAKKIAGEIVNRKVDPAKTSPEEFISRLKRAGQRNVLPLRDLEALLKKVMTNDRRAVEDFQRGKDGALQFLVGQAMRASKGSADPRQAREILAKLLGKG